MTAIQASGRFIDTITLRLPDFRLQPEEPLGAGLKRLSLQELDAAISGFYDGEGAFREAVHDARKATKKVRALLRLVRAEIGDKVYRFENTWLRDTARRLSPVRGAAVAVEAFDLIRDLYGPLLAEGTFEETWHRLVTRRDRAEERAMEDPDLLPRVVGDLERARARYQAWPAGEESRSVYGMGIRHDFAALGPGLDATYRRGRREMVVAYQQPAPEHFHRWRKRVKYLRHQMEILTPIWPEVMVAMAITFDRIGELLGEEHDLAELLRLVAERRDLCPNPMERSLFAALAEQRRSDLQTACRILGRRVFAETPGALEERISAYWESRDQARTVTLASRSA